MNANFSATATEVNDNQARLTTLESEVNANFSSIEQSVDDNSARVSNLEGLHPTGLTHIEYLNWQHYGEITVQDFLSDGLVIWFSNEVSSESLIPPNLNYHVQLFKYEGLDWELEFDVGFNQVTEVTIDSNSTISGQTLVTGLPQDTAQGLQIILINLIDTLGVPGVYKVVIRGDFVIDVDGRAVDGNFVGAKTPSGDGIEGGTFESIIRVVL